MQEMLLCKKGKEIAWMNIYLLHRMWKEYREGDVIQKDHELSETTSYRQVIQDYS